MTSSARNFVLAAALASAWAAATAPAGQAAERPRPPAHAPQQGYSPAAQRVLAQARAASGGAGWSLLRGWQISGRQGGVRYESWFDTLRYGMRVETHEAAGVSVRGFNGQGAWRITPSGQAAGIEDRAQVAQARTEAFLGAQGFLYPGRFDAHGEFLGVRQAHGRVFDVVNVQPWDGTPRELWFDRSTHLLARIIDRTTAQPVTTELSDYRRVGSISVAFHISVEGPGATRTPDRQIDSVVFTPADRALFSLPRPG